jgi:hypothetical protein
MHVLPARGDKLLAGDVRARAGARGRLHATPQPHRSSAWTWRPTSSPPPRARGPTGLGASPPPAPPHEPISDFAQRLPPGAMGPKHTPALAHKALKPQAIARRRVFRKATHRFAPPAQRWVCHRRRGGQKQATAANLQFHAQSACSRAGAARSAKGAKGGSPDLVPHADGHGGRGTGQPKDNGMDWSLTAPRRSSC